MVQARCIESNSLAYTLCYCNNLQQVCLKYQELVLPTVQQIHKLCFNDRNTLKVIKKEVTDLEANEQLGQNYLKDRKAIQG